MPKYQWLCFGDWKSCTPKNNVLLSQRYSNPSLKPIELHNEVGRIVGCPEHGEVHFIVDGDDEPLPSLIRQIPEDGEWPLYAVINEHGEDILSPEASKHLFTRNGPRRNASPIDCGMQTFHTENGTLMQGLIPRHWKKKTFSHADYHKMTKTRYSWEFRGPMREVRMEKAVEQVIQQADDVTVNIIGRFWEDFDPNADNSEYGPTQFPDYLMAFGHHGVAIQVLDAFNAQPLNDWRPMDALTNMRIESCRENHEPIAVVHVDGQLYSVIFDTGTGASGQGAVLVRPTRYQKILESIEEQFHAATSAHRDTVTTQLYEALVQHNINPTAFLLVFFQDQHGAYEDAALMNMVPNDAARAHLRSIIDQIGTSTGHLSTRIQRFMPTLLEKFKECEIRLCKEETRDPKPCCPELVATMKTGLKIPDTWRPHCNSLSDLMQFVRKTDSWELPRGRHTCDICSETCKRTLTHCGDAKVCLKCWADTLVETKMACPFCRQIIGESDLKTSVFVPAVKVDPQKSTGKRKRERKWTPRELLEQIHQDEKYTEITESTSFDMRKWFTILLRCQLVKVHQMPRNKHGAQNFKTAMKAFKLI
tara:strand:+ start:807 stop:2576 length:1770 start_codon:yes stop_codon:yes gene_type:complete